MLRVVILVTVGPVEKQQEAGSSSCKKNKEAEAFILHHRGRKQEVAVVKKHKEAEAFILHHRGRKQQFLWVDRVK